MVEREQVDDPVGQRVVDLGLGGASGEERSTHPAERACAVLVPVVGRGALGGGHRAPLEKTSTCAVVQRATTGVAAISVACTRRTPLRVRR